MYDRLWFLIIASFAFPVWGQVDLTALYREEPRQDLWIPFGGVECVAQTEDTIYFGGLFEYVGPNNGSAVLVDTVSGEVVSGFPTVHNGVYDVIGDGAGGVHIVGNFDVLEGRTQHNIAHVDGNGDVVWDPDMFVGSRLYAVERWDEEVITVGVEGRIYSFSTVTGAKKVLGSAYGQIHDLLVWDSTLFIGGAFTQFNGVPRSGLAAVDLTTGDLLPWAPMVGFNSGTAGVVALARHDDLLLVGGDFHFVDNQSIRSLAALDPGTGATSSFPMITHGGVVRTIVASDANIYVGGGFDEIDSTECSGLAAISTSDKSIAPWFPQVLLGQVPGSVHAIHVSGDVVYFGGQFDQVNEVTRRNAAAVDTNTGVLLPWHPRNNGVVKALVPQQGSLLVAGSLESVGGDYRRNLAAIDVLSGGLTDWNPGADLIPMSMSITNETLYVGGEFRVVGGVERHHAAAFDLQTGDLNEWNPDVLTESYHTVVRAIHHFDGHVAMGGYFNRVGGVDRQNLAVVDSRTAGVSAVNPWIWGPVFSLQSDDMFVYAGGQFTDRVSESKAILRRFTALTGEMDPWAANVSIRYEAEPIWDIEIMGDRVYSAGDITNGAGEIRNGGACLDRLSGALYDWNPSHNNGLLELNSLESIGTTLVYAGNFLVEWSSHEMNDTHVYAVDSITGYEHSWYPKTDQEILCIDEAYQRLILGGAFTMVNGEWHRSLAVFDPVPTLPSGLLLTGQ